jgi:hypothetical protein
MRIVVKAADQAQAVRRSTAEAATVWGATR